MGEGDSRDGATADDARDETNNGDDKTQHKKVDTVDDNVDEPVRAPESLADAREPGDVPEPVDGDGGADGADSAPARRKKRAARAWSPPPPFDAVISEAERADLSRTCQVALYYARALKWAVVPLHSVYTPTAGRDAGIKRCSCKEAADCTHMGKHPRNGKNWYKAASTREDTIKNWFNKRWPRSNIGIATGKKSGIVVVDVDYPNGADSLDDLQRRFDDLPHTVTAITGGGGRHHVFAYPEGYRGTIANSAGQLADNVDVRADNGQIVVAPSVHDSGARYKWLEGSKPSEVPIADLPASWLKALTTKTSKTRRQKRIALPTQITTRIDAKTSKYGDSAIARAERRVEEAAPGTHNATLNRHAFRLGQLSAAGYIDREVAEHKLYRAAVKRAGCSQREAEQTIRSGMDAGAKQPRGPGYAVVSVGVDLTDVGNAKRFVMDHGPDVRYVVEWGSWIVWDGRRWEIDRKNLRVMALAAETANGIYEEAAEFEDDDIRQAISKFAGASKNVGRLQAMVLLAASEPGIAISHDQLDSDPLLLNCKNGTLDLSTGKLRPHEQEDLCTKLAPVDYNPRATAPQWEKFLARVMNGNQNLIDFLQRAVGYSLTGSTGNECFFLLYGIKRNGKSTFVETIKNMLGDYGTTAEFSTFTEKKNDAVRNDIAGLVGTRFVSASESKEGARLDEQIVKQLTGSDSVKARFLYQELFTFMPQFKIWLACNHKPVIRGTDHAIWERVRLVPFTVTIPKAERDPKLRAKLASELPGILAWAVRGCVEWYDDDNNLAEPREILAATDEFHEEMDILGAFLRDCCDQSSPDAMIAGADLYGTFKEWSELVGERGSGSMSKRTFAIKLKERGLKQRRTNTARGWMGITLRPKSEWMTPNPDGFEQGGLYDDEIVDDEPYNPELF